MRRPLAALAAWAMLSLARAHAKAREASSASSTQHRQAVGFAGLNPPCEHRQTENGQ
jgi:hypothetical protein